MNAKRGYLPKDQEYFSPIALATMRLAARHICYLLNEGYELKQAMTFVGNHFSLAERQRLAISRSVAASAQLERRRAKEKMAAIGEEIWIDGFNTIITLEVMLSGSMLFVGMDGAIRDLAALRGSYKIIPETEVALLLLLDTLEELTVKSVHILLDKPVSNSGRLKTLIATLGEGRPYKLDIQIIKAVDKELWTKENVITSDSIILDHCKSWINLSQICLAKGSGPIFKVWE